MHSCDLCVTCNSCEKKVYLAEEKICNVKKSFKKVKKKHLSYFKQTPLFFTCRYKKGINIIGEKAIPYNQSFRRKYGIILNYSMFYIKVIT